MWNGLTIALAASVTHLHTYTLTLLYTRGGTACTTPWCGLLVKEDTSQPGTDEQYDRWYAIEVNRGETHHHYHTLVAIFDRRWEQTG